MHTHCFMTTFAEALHQDIPSILVVDRESSVLMQEMNHIESMMVEAGLLHFDPWKRPLSLMKCRHGLIAGGLAHKS